MKFIWAIMEIYWRNLKYISDYGDISAQLKIYQRFLKYIDLSTKHNKKRRALIARLFVILLYNGYIHYLKKEG